MKLTEEPLLKVQNLKVHFYTLRGVVHALERVSFSLNGFIFIESSGNAGPGRRDRMRQIGNRAIHFTADRSARPYCQRQHFF